MVRMSLQSASMYRCEAWMLYSSSPQPVKDLTQQFFQSMDVNCDGGVNWAEIQRFFGSGASNILIHPPFPPQLQHQLFFELDQDRDGSLNFSEFITFFHCLFLRARCNQCQRDLLGDDYTTCVDCYAYAGSQSGYATFDVCSTCNSTYGFTHYHCRTRFKKFKDVIFSEMFMAASMAQSGMATGTNFMTHSGMAHSGSNAGTNFMSHSRDTNFMSPNGGTNFMAPSGGTTGSTSNFEIEPRREPFRRSFIALQSAAALATIGGCTIM